MTIYADELDLHLLVTPAEPTEKGRNQAASQSQAAVIRLGRIKARFGAKQLQCGRFVYHSASVRQRCWGRDTTLRVLLLRSPTWLDAPSRSNGPNVQDHHAPAHGVLGLRGLHQPGQTEGMVS